MPRPTSPRAGRRAAPAAASKSDTGTTPAKPRGPVAAYRLLVEYEGTKFHGWQRQTAATGPRGAPVRTVVGSLERVVVDGGWEVVDLQGSGRTDAGVHALGQVAHLHLPASGAPTPEELAATFDDLLPTDLAVRTIERCSAKFHARHDAVSRSYLYSLARRRTGLAKPFVWWVRDDLDPAKLFEAWSVFQGFGNFAAFADLSTGDDPRVDVTRTESVEVDRMILLRVTASHFLRRQVRRMVGAAVAVADGSFPIDRLREDLARPTPGAALRWSKRTSPPSGLVLEAVRYEGDPELPPPAPLFRVP